MRPRFAVPIVAAALAGASPLAAPDRLPAGSRREARVRAESRARREAHRPGPRGRPRRAGAPDREPRRHRGPRGPPRRAPPTASARRSCCRCSAGRAARAATVCPATGSWSCWPLARSPARTEMNVLLRPRHRVHVVTRRLRRRLRKPRRARRDRAAGHRPAARERAGAAGRRGDAAEDRRDRAGPALGVRRAVRRDDHRGRARHPARRAGPGACARGPAVAGSRRPGAARAADAARAARAAALEVLVQLRGAARHADTRRGGGRRARGPRRRARRPPGPASPASLPTSSSRWRWTSRTPGGSLAARGPTRTLVVRARVRDMEARAAGTIAPEELPPEAGDRRVLDRRPARRRRRTAHQKREGERARASRRSPRRRGTRRASRSRGGRGRTRGRPAPFAKTPAAHR